MTKYAIIGEGERIELLDGELIALPGVAPEHLFTLQELTEKLIVMFAGRAIVKVQSALALDEYSDVHPDLMLLAPHAHRYRSGLPVPADVSLAIEISDWSWRYDRYSKLAAYARAGIPEVWLVRLGASCVFQFRRPNGGTYLEEHTFARGTAIGSAAFPNETLEVEALLV